MRFRVLGPVEIESDDGHLQTLVRRQERCLLAMLLLEPNRVLHVDRLCQMLWDDSPPPQARRAVHAHVARIRAALVRARAPGAGTAADVEVVSHRDGYLLRLDPLDVDVHRFRLLVKQAGNTNNLHERDRLLREALDLWRGPALHRAVGSDRLRQRLCAELDEQRLQALEAWLATGLELGRQVELLPELAKLNAESPVRERIVELHMTALYRQRRTAEALAVYSRARTHLADGLGLDPGPALQRLHRAILRGDVATDPAASAPRPPGRAVTPAQLPADIPAFAGRSAELFQLDALLATGPSMETSPAPPPRTVVISALSGTTGGGRTALAVR
jgi:DNA-binding SARP family transcriptional activator